MFVAVTVSIAFVLHLLICKRLGRPRQMQRYRLIVWIALSLLFLLTVLNPLSWVVQLELGKGLRTAAYTAMGIYSFIFTALVIREVLWGLARAGSLLPDDPSRRELIGHGVNLAMLGAAAVGATAGYREAQRRARVVEVPVPIDGLPPELEGLRIVQLSDIHVGPTIDRGYVEAIADAVDRLDADLIALTGDLVDARVSKIRNDVEPLARMKSRYGIYVCTGNHEYYAGAEDWIAEFRRLGMKVLINEHTVIEHNGRKILLGGVTDPQGARFLAGHASDPKACLLGDPGCDLRVLLAHRPASVYEASAAGFDLQLSGHTHGGQFFPWNLVVKLVHEYPAGLAKHGRTWLYTSRGTGYFGPPFRLGAPSEITVVELKRA